MLEKDPINSQGRLGGSTRVRNNAQYVVAAGTQTGIAFIFWAILGHFLIVPWLGVTFVVIVALPLFVLHTASTAAFVIVGMLLVSLWIYLSLWRCLIKPLAKRGPSITYADGYRGPLKNGKTVYTYDWNKPSYR